MKKLLIAFLLALFIPLVTFASGKMIIGAGEVINLEAKSDIRVPVFKWVLLEGETIVDTKTGQNYTYNFQIPGEYKLNLIATSEYSDEVENTSVEILVGSSVSFNDSVNIKLNTLPELTGENSVELGANKELSFILSGSQGNIEKYLIDADTSIDRDGDGDPVNDVDNSEDSSFHNGQLWSYDYSEAQLPTQARITIKDVNGNEDIQDISILPPSQIAQGLKATMELFPAAKSDKRVYLTGESAEVHVFSAASQGNIIEYRIDTDTTVDSDGDGNPANDIDNLNHPSFTTGEIYSIPVKRALGDKIMQLTVVSAEGKGSLVQRKIVWTTDRNLVENQDFRLYSDTLTPYVGKVIHFGLEGGPLADGTSVKWDFDGDKITDLENNSKLASFSYSTPGNYEVLAQIKNEDQGLLKYATLNVSVDPKPSSEFSTNPPISNFAFTTDGNKVSFENKSSADSDLENEELTYKWYFGDGKTSEEEAPEHIYQVVKNYIVRLQVSDITGQSHEKQMLVEIKELTYNSSEPEDELEDEDEEVVIPETGGTVDPEDLEEDFQEPSSGDEGGSILGAFFAFLLTIIGALGTIIGGYLVFQKIKHPHFTFGEIMEEEKEKILSILEGREYTAPSGEIVATEKEVSGDVAGVLEDTTKADKVRESVKEDVKPKDPEKTIQEEQIEEAKVEPVQSTPSKTTTHNSNVGDVPPWMQDLPPVKEEKKEAPKEITPTDPTANNTNEVPAWMQDIQKTEEKKKETPKAPQTPQMGNQNTPAAAPSTPTNPTTQPPQTPPPTPPTPPTPPAQEQKKDDDDDIPDWLK